MMLSRCLFACSSRARAILERTAVPMPHARHGQLLEGEKIMEEALDWLFADRDP